MVEMIVEVEIKVEDVPTYFPSCNFFISLFLLTLLLFLFFFIFFKHLRRLE